MNKLLASLLVLPLSLSATNYFVDVATGSDSAAGTSTSVPWAHVPGSVGVSTGSGWPANFANGDKIIVKGGSVNNFKVLLTNTSHSGFYNGASSFDSIIIQSGDLFSPQWGTTSAIFDEQNTRAYGFFIEIGAGGVTIDGFEIRNIADAQTITPDDQGSAGIEISYGDHFTIKRCWIHDCNGHADDRGHGIEGGQQSLNGFIIAQNHIGPNIGSKALETIRLSSGAVTNNFFDVTKYQGDHVCHISRDCTNIDVANNLIYIGPNSGPTAFNGVFQTAGNNNYSALATVYTDHCDVWNNVVYGTAPTASHGISAFYSYGFTVTNRYFHNTFALLGDKNNDGAGAPIAFMKQNDANGNATGCVWQNNLFYKGGDSDGNIQWCVVYANIVDHENVQYNDFWGGGSTSENVMGYRPSGSGNDVLSPVSSYNPPTTGHTYANNVQLDPAITLGTLPTGMDSLYHPNTLYFAVTASAPSSVKNTANAVTGGNPYGWVRSSTKFVLDIVGNTRSAYAMGAYEVPVDPTITNQPTSQSVTAGSTATFSVGASGLSSLSYQWYTNNGSGNVAVTGATSSSWTTPATVLAWDQLSVYVVVTDTAGNIQSTVVKLTVTTSGNAPTITTQPQSQTVFVTQNAMFSVVATGTAPLTYQWSTNGVNLAGATSSTLAVNNCQLAQSGTAYSVGVTNASGWAVSSSAILTVLGGTPPNSVMYVTNATVGTLHFGGAP